MPYWGPAPVDIEKALDSLTSSGTALIPQIINPHIAELALKVNPLRQLIPRKQWNSATYDRNKRSDFGAARYIRDSSTAQETNSTISRFQEPLKLLQSKGGVSGFLQAGSKEVADAFQTEVDGHTIATTYEEEVQHLYGNRYADTYAPNGFDTWIETNRFQSGVLVGNTILDDMINSVKRIGGTPRAFVMSFSMLSRLSAILLYGQQRWMDKVEIEGGAKLLSYLNIPIYPTSFINADVAWPGGAPGASASAGGSLPDAHYFYKIAAVLNTGETLPAAEADATTATTNNSVTITWTTTGLENVRYYKVYRSTTTGTEKLYTVIPGQVSTVGSDILGEIAFKVIGTYIDNGVRTTQTLSYSGASCTGAAYTPGTNQSLETPLVAHGEDIYLFSAVAPGKVDGAATEVEVLREMQYMPLAKIADKDWFLIVQYSTLIMIEQFSAKARNVLLSA